MTMKTKIAKAGRVGGAGAIICSVGVAVGIMYKNLEKGTLDYPLRVTPEFVQDMTGKFEGCRFKKYKDGGGIDTIGVGTTSAICGEITKNEFTYEEIAKWLNKGLWEAEQCVNNNFKGAILPQRVFESLVDMVYNNGCTAVSNNKNGQMTKIRRYALQQNYTALCNGYMDWTYGRNAKGQKVQIKGLYLRRLANKEWCLRND